MSRGLSRSLLVASIATLLAAHAGASGASSAAAAPILKRFLALDDPTPSQYRALRHLEARNEKFEKNAWMDVWTEGDASGFHYVVVSEDGSEYIRSKVFRATLETERRMWAAGAPDQAAVTMANYVFEDRGAQPDGLTLLTVTPRRKDVLLVDGSIFLNPDDGELVRMEGRLSKSPSFWTRHVEIVRWYRRILGFRMPTALESVASVRIAGLSTFRMSYEYESINGQRVGNPQPRVLARASTTPPHP
jgi:hypothetical protein